ncbi:hypothetical protein FOPG_18941 [Fusarium oxysporum f. sp. conglutinans race 2 54008]|uniref:Uncharacterized protein n=1 Tax=Fusarium oxysporum f. sp. conglutinans race 2 54008 TaxID=1089457 RepID=X0HUJ4_FUSOX|nr:hypothetical protein FOPG_18941 [Fusarium oxysporum f. sp. conglutinans race 2 54008]
MLALVEQEQSLALSHHSESTNSRIGKRKAGLIEGTDDAQHRDNDRPLVRYSPLPPSSNTRSTTTQTTDCQPVQALAMAATAATPFPSRVWQA